jgi:hypothetical protein
MLAKLCVDVLHYEINCHMIVSSVPWMDDGTDGWKASFCPQRPLLYVIYNLFNLWEFYNV